MFPLEHYTKGPARKMRKKMRKMRKNADRIPPPPCVHLTFGSLMCQFPLCRILVLRKIRILLGVLLALGCAMFQKGANLICHKKKKKRCTARHSRNIFPKIPIIELQSFQRPNATRPWCTPPPPFRREKPNILAQHSGEPFFQQKRFPVPRISVPGHKHTFLLVVLWLE